MLRLGQESAKFPSIHANLDTLIFGHVAENFIMVVGNGENVQFLAPNDSAVYPEVGINFYACVG